MAGYLGNIPTPQATQTRDTFTATSGQTSFATSGYTVGMLDVYLNGIKLASADFTATNGSDVVLASGASTGDIVEVVSFSTFDSASGAFSVDLKSDKLLNKSGDQDSGIDLSTNDVVAVKTANTERVRVKATGEILHTLPSEDTTFAANTDSTWNRFEIFQDRGASDTASGIAFRSNSGTAPAGIASVAGNTTGGIESLVFITAAGNASAERMRIASDGVFMVGTTDTSIYNNSSGSTADNGISYDTYALSVGRTNGTVFMVNRTFSDGDLISLRQNGTEEGTISVSTSTVSYNGFSGLHETSGIASNVAIGTVCSTIDTLDVYPDTQKNVKGESEPHKKKGQTRKDHAKIKVSDSAGDKRVYGVLQRYDNNDKPLVASVGIGSVLVTGACEGGDLLESNGDGTAKVQSDDIVKSKTIGKVTIGNSSTDVKLVSCVLYCG